jgi:hypothetical protein
MDAAARTEADLLNWNIDKDSIVELIEGRRDPKSHLERKFKQYHSDNPQVFNMFSLFTREAIDKGHPHMSADMIAHRIRWEVAMGTIERNDENPDKPTLKLKIGNNYIAYYARLWMERNPSHKGFFRTRKVTGDNDDG